MRSLQQDHFFPLIGHILPFPYGRFFLPSLTGLFQTNGRSTKKSKNKSVLLLPLHAEVRRKKKKKLLPNKQGKNVLVHVQIKSLLFLSSHHQVSFSQPEGQRNIEQIWLLAHCSTERSNIVFPLQRFLHEVCFFFPQTQFLNLSDFLIHISIAEQSQIEKDADSTTGFSSWPK